MLRMACGSDELPVDYSPTFLRNEKVGAVDCNVLEPTQTQRGQTYQRIVYWLRTEDCASVRAEFYLTSATHQVRHF